jgi:hypothetical protein
VYHGRKAKASNQNAPSILKCEVIRIYNLIFAYFCAINRKKLQSTASFTLLENRVVVLQAPMKSRVNNETSGKRVD